MRKDVQDAETEVDGCMWGVRQAVGDWLFCKMGRWRGSRLRGVGCIVERMIRYA